MKVCIISPNLPIPAVKGGAIEKIIEETILYYRHSNITIFSEAIIKEDRRWTDKDVNYIQLKTTLGRIKIQNFLNKIAWRGIFGLYNFFFIRNVISAIDSPPDIFHLHNNFYHIDLLKKKFPKSRIILHMHNNFFFLQPNLLNKYKSIVEKMDVLITVSNYIARLIISNYDAFPKKIVTIHNGVSLKLFKELPRDDPKLLQLKKDYGISENDKVIMFVGRVCEDKGVHILIKAVKNLIRINKSIKLMILGTSWFSDGKPTKYVKEIIEESKEIKDHVVFTGFIPHDRLNYFYNLSLLCIVPSIFNDPCPLVLTESMAAGTVLVASSVGGIPEIIKDGVTGSLVPSNDAEALGSKIQSLLENKTLHNKLKTNALDSVHKNGDWSKIAQKFEDLYTDALL